MNNFSNTAQNAALLTNKESRFAAFCKSMGREIAFHKHDFWQLLALVVGIFAIFSTVLLVIFHFTNVAPSDDAWTIVGVMPVVISILTLLLCTGSLFYCYYPLAIQMSVPRKRALLQLTLLCALYEAALFLFCFCVFLAVAIISADVVGAFTFLAQVPYWVWVLCAVLPLSLPICWVGILFRFGRTAGLIAYFVCIAPVYAGSYFENLAERFAPFFASFAAYMWMLPVIGCALAFVPFFVGIALLHKHAIK